MTKLLAGRASVWVSAAVLVACMVWQMLAATHREVITNDEGFHTYAGYRYWQCGDFGVNPEHPPLAKMVAASALRLTGTAPPGGSCPVVSTAKASGYADSAEWLYSSGGLAPPSLAVDRIIPMARRDMALFAVLLAATSFLFTKRLFGDASALAALTLICFEPSLIAHGALVTTDMALSAASLLAVAAYFLLHRKLGPWRLLLAGLCCGFALSMKHSGVLILPTLFLLSTAELVLRWKEEKGLKARAMLAEGATFLLVASIGVGFLWATYHFRYAARPGGMQMTVSLSSFIADTQAKENKSLILKAIPTLARHHLLPEAYLYGFVDVLSISDPGQSAFLFGRLYPHGVPQYFPSVVLIKSTLGMIGLALLAFFTLRKRLARFDLRLYYFLVPALVWMLAGINSTLNIGYRHILPVIAPACCLLGVAAVALWKRGGPLMRGAVALLLLAHVGSSLASFPNELAYGNELAGGVANSHNLLTDSNNDWGQALPQLAAWLSANQVRDCWFAYDGFAKPLHSGIGCRRIIANLFELNGDKGEAQLARLQTGTFIISGLSLSGIEWERPDLNPYEAFQRARPRAVVGGADMVYTGTFDMSRVLAVTRLAEANDLNGKEQFSQALDAATAALAALPTSAFAHLARASALAGLKRNREAHEEYAQAETIAAAQPEWYFLQRAEIRDGLNHTSDAPRTNM